MTEIINATPHELVIFDEDHNPLLRLPKSGRPFRVAERTTTHEPITAADHRIPVVRISFAEIEPPLPAPVDGTWWVTSHLVAAAAPERDDLLIPTQVVRDAAGRILGCRALGRLS